VLLDEAKNVPSLTTYVEKAISVEVYDDGEWQKCLLNFKL
jgi:hypothetical protein